MFLSKRVIKRPLVSLPLCTDLHAVVCRAATLKHWAVSGLSFPSVFLLLGHWSRNSAYFVLYPRSYVMKEHRRLVFAPFVRPWVLASIFFFYCAVLSCYSVFLRQTVSLFKNCKERQCACGVLEVFAVTWQNVKCHWCLMCNVWAWNVWTTHAHMQHIASHLTFSYTYQCLLQVNVSHSLLLELL